MYILYVTYQCGHCGQVFYTRDQLSTAEKAIDQELWLRDTLTKQGNKILSTRTEVVKLCTEENN